MSATAEPASRRRGGFVLDSHALLAYFEGESSGAAAHALLRDAERRRVRVYLSLINWGEVLYIVRREKGGPCACCAASTTSTTRRSTS